MSIFRAKKNKKQKKSVNNCVSIDVKRLKCKTQYEKFMINVNEQKMKNGNLKNNKMR